MKKSKILIIKWGALGDVLIASFAIQQIALYHPDSDIYLFTAPPFGKLFAANSMIKLALFPRKGFKMMLNALGWIRGHQFSIIFDMQSSDRTKLLTYFGNATTTYGFKPSKCYQHNHHSKAQHPFDRINAMLELASIPAAKQSEFEVAKADQEMIANWLKQHQLKAKQFVLMHAGCSTKWQSKRWPHFLPLAQQICKKYPVTIIWIGANEDQEINEALSQSIGINATHCFSIVALIQLAKLAKFSVTNDSAPMHMLACANTPLFSIFGPTDFEYSYPYAQKEHVIYHPVHCSPCHQPICPIQNQHVCMQQLTVDKVLDKIVNAL